jgi:hypothetical protein
LLKNNERKMLENKGEVKIIEEIIDKLELIN